MIELINYSFLLAKLQLIVGHNPKTAKVANHYVMKKGFDFKGDKIFLEGTLEGGGYWINTLEKRVVVLNQQI